MSRKNKIKVRVRAKKEGALTPETKKIEKADETKKIKVPKKPTTKVSVTNKTKPKLDKKEPEKMADDLKRSQNGKYPHYRDNDMSAEELDGFLKDLIG